MNIIKLDSINSTNTYCNYRLKDGDISTPFAVVAREQYAGRGRYGSSFYSPKDSGVYLSYAFSAKYSEQDLLKLTVVAASITHRLLSEHCEDELSIKWINDIYRDGRKLAGILTELIGDPNISDVYHIIIGVGINVFCPDSAKIPEELENSIGFLSDEEKSRDFMFSLAEKLVASLDAVFGKATSGKAADFHELIDYYKSHCINLPADFGDELLDL